MNRPAQNLAANAGGESAGPVAGGLFGARITALPLRHRASRIAFSRGSTRRGAAARGFDI